MVATVYPQSVIAAAEGRVKPSHACKPLGNAAVVGLLLAALYQPVWTSAVRTPADFVVALSIYGLLVFWRAPPWLVVGLAALAGKIWLT